MHFHLSNLKLRGVNKFLKVIQWLYAYMLTANKFICLYNIQSMGLPHIN